MPPLRDRIRELRRVPANSLIPNPKNWRTHPAAQQDALRGLLAEVGYADALLVRELPGGGLMLVDGHLRAETSGDAMVPVLVLDVTEGEADKILATLDPLAAMAEADSAKLDALLKEIETESEAVEAMLAGLAQDAGLAEEVVPGAGGDEFDATPEASGPTRTAVGDLWEIGGKHRLLVGDCTDPANVVILMGNDRATCVFTDPPYGVSQAAKNRILNEQAGGKGVRPSRNETDIADDDLSPDDLKARLLPAFENYRTLAMSEDCSMMVCSPQGAELAMMMMMMKEAGLPPRHVLIWKKNQPTFSMNRLDYDYQHEPILFTWTTRHKKNKGGTFKTSIWEVDKPRASADHPTMKPVELYVAAYENHSDQGDVVADFYGGSGTAVIAAHRTNRRARLCEIDPRYADVILKRAEAEGLAVEKIG